MSHRREPALGQRFDHFSLEELSKAEKLSETPKMEKLPEVSKAEKLPETPKKEKLSETPKKEKLPEVSKTEKKEMETEVVKAEKKETLHTTVSHLARDEPGADACFQRGATRAQSPAISPYATKLPPCR